MNLTARLGLRNVRAAVTSGPLGPKEVTRSKGQPITLQRAGHRYTNDGPSS